MIRKATRNRTWTAYLEFGGGDIVEIKVTCQTQRLPCLLYWSIRNGAALNMLMKAESGTVTAILRVKLMTQLTV